jgi:exopolysaccharide biosynthesis polyprenyl glycosylphosphotransferase
LSSPAATPRARAVELGPAPLPVPVGLQPQSRRALENRIAFCADSGALLLAVIVMMVAEPFSTRSDALNWVAVTATGILFSLAVSGAYERQARQPLAQMLRQVWTVPALVVLVVTAVRLLAGEAPSSASLIITWVVTTGALVSGRVGGRMLVRSRSLRSTFDQRVLIVGAGEVGHRVARRLLAQPELGLVPVGFLDKEPREHRLGDLPVLGASWDLERIVEEQKIDTVIVAFSTAPHHVLLGLVKRCWGAGVNVMLVPRLFEAESTRAQVQHLGGLPLVGVVGTDARSWQLRVKHALDRIGALVLLTLLSPLMLLISAGVLLSLGRPIFYKQRRVGRDGHVFDMYKFRTMRAAKRGEGEADADWAAAMLGTLHVVPSTASSAEDRRTGFGTFLRSWSLDELPQIFNVLNGDMSLIGPRPERVHYVEHFNEAIYRYADRHRVRSGMTGWAQVNGLRGRTSLEDRVEWDNFYIENWNLWLDLKILVLSVLAVVRTREHES